MSAPNRLPPTRVGGDEYCGNDSGLKIVIAKDLHDIIQEFHPIMTGIIDAPDEGADEGRSRPGRQQSLQAEKTKVTLTRIPSPARTLGSLVHPELLGS